LKVGSSSGALNVPRSSWAMTPARCFTADA
jgi:hypothetical protein